MKTILFIAGVFFSCAVMAQPAEKKSVVIGSLTSKPNALLIVNPQNSDQGVLLPQLSTGQRMSLKPSSPAEDGLIVFDNNLKSYFYWSAGSWMKLHTDGGARTSYHSIDPLSFQELKPENSIKHNNLIVFESENTFVTARPNGAGEEIIAPVNLPHDAIIQEVTLFYMDNDVRNLKVYLMRKSFSGQNEQIFEWESSGASAMVSSQTFSAFNSLGTIDLENYTYRFVVVFDIDDGESVDLPSQAKQRIYGVKIKYQP